MKNILGIFSLLITLFVLSGCDYNTSNVQLPVAPGPLSSAPLPTSVTIVFDTSGSMEGDRLKQAKQVVTNWIANSPKGIVWSLFTFDQFTPVVEYTTDSNKIVAKINSLYASGGTPLIHTSELAEKYVVARRTGIKSPEQEILLILTDGEDSSASNSNVAARLAVISKNVTTYMVGYELDNPVYAKAVSNYSVANNAAMLQATLDNIPLEK